jgi:hypothetical protein
MNGMRFFLARWLRLLSLVGLSGAVAACAGFGAPSTNTPPTTIVGQFNAQGTPSQPGYPGPATQPPCLRACRQPPFRLQLRQSRHNRSLSIRPRLARQSAARW